VTRERGIVSAASRRVRTTAASRRTCTRVSARTPSVRERS